MISQEVNTRKRATFGEDRVSIDIVGRYVDTDVRASVYIHVVSIYSSLSGGQLLVFQEVNLIHGTCTKASGLERDFNLVHRREM